MNPSYDFAGLVTGASSGMGLATARAFAEAGASAVLADVNQAALTSVTDELAAAGHQVLGVPCDVADEDQVAALITTTVDTFAGSTWPSTTPASSSRSAMRPTNRRRPSTE
jgi:NAD(P)-dependent dehydrogenase (short-subunit alcohol dehydrogenase family)